MQHKLNTEEVDQFQARYPDISEHTKEIVSLHGRKLWHQAQEKIGECLDNKQFQSEQKMIQFYQTFVAMLPLKISILKYARFTYTVSTFIVDQNQAIAFIEDALDRLKSVKSFDIYQLEQAEWYLRATQVMYMVQLGKQQECRNTVEELIECVQIGTKVDPMVTARVYFCASQFHKAQQKYAAFYRTSLQYLCYIKSEDLDQQYKTSLAVDIALAALLGKEVYNFGDLLLHPIVEVLKGSKQEWLHEVLYCFNDGDMHQYDQLCVKYADLLNAQPALVEHEQRLKEKLTIMCLLELVHSMPPEHRQIQLTAIAERTKLDVDGVEFLLMRTMALGLLKGTIDQVNGVVEITWVQPRVMTMPQVTALKDKLNKWLSSVESAYFFIDGENSGFVEAQA